ncbi:hypothetical protein CLF_102317 [Clonorchis sinensis]|uniref:Uncharacterized protein n=1 Tax=Clonorchis sinensis TaxID=79923 RepID=G7YN13_CLOSI|nr:hypothetical protein CLF_102317 [Clonorchis sinensis]
MKRVSRCLAYFPLEYRRLRGDLILPSTLVEQGLANKCFTVDPTNVGRERGEQRPLNNKCKPDPGILGPSLDPVHQSVNQCKGEDQQSGGRLKYFMNSSQCSQMFPNFRQLANLI